MMRLFIKSFWVPVVLNSLTPLPCAAEVRKFKCNIDEKQKPDVWAQMQELDIIYSEQVLVLNEQDRYISIYQRIGRPPQPLMWNYQNPNKWHDGDIVAEGQGAFGVGNGIIYVRFIGDKVKFGVIWGGWPTNDLTFDKRTGILQDSFTYYCEQLLDEGAKFK